MNRFAARNKAWRHHNGYATNFVYRAVAISHEALHTIGIRHDKEASYTPCTGTAQSAGVAMRLYQCTDDFCYGFRYPARSMVEDEIRYSMGDRGDKNAGYCLTMAQAVETVVN